MAFTVIQAGTSLQMVDNLGVVSAPLTLPAGVTLRSDVPPRFHAYGGFVILTNTPSQSLTIDNSGIVRLLCPKPPRLAASLTGTSGGSLSGTYQGVRYTFVVRDGDGQLIAESDYSPASGSVTISGQYLTASGLDVSPDAVSGRRLYRPTTNGAVNFPWVDLDGNVLTSISDDLPDAGLGLVAGPVLGTPPDLMMITDYKSRLFGVGRLNIDELRYTEVDRIYAWPADNVFPVELGVDNIGIRGLAARRDALGIGRQNAIKVLTGEDDTDFRVTNLSENVGFSSQEAVATYRDTTYFLWEDGVYQWDDSGIVCISDGKVRSWFASDDYFDRTKFQYAFGHVDPQRNKYRLYLQQAGNTGLVQWVEFDLRDRTWWGPHKTTAFTPTSSFVLLDGNLISRSVVGSLLGDLNQQTETRTDGIATPIAMDAVSKRFAMLEPDLEKYWGELSVIGKAQAAGTLNIGVSTGELNAAETNNFGWDMSIPRQRLGRVGIGKHVQIELTNTEVAQDVDVFGIEVDPVNILGRR